MPEPQNKRACAGQSLIESCLAIGILSLLLFGVVQIAMLIAAKEVLNHAAARGARARAVGFNEWMVAKVVRVGAIATAGPIAQPVFENESIVLRDLVENERVGTVWSSALAMNPSSSQFALERHLIPEYLGSRDGGLAQQLLDYRDWPSITSAAEDLDTVPGGDPETDRIIAMRVEQPYPLWVPMHRAFYAEDSVPLTGVAYMESHFPLYMTDDGW